MSDKATATGSPGPSRRPRRMQRRTEMRAEYEPPEDEVETEGNYTYAPKGSNIYARGALQLHEQLSHRPESPGSEWGSSDTEFDGGGRYPTHVGGDAVFGHRFDSDYERWDHRLTRPADYNATEGDVMRNRDRAREAAAAQARERNPLRRVGRFLRRNTERTPSPCQPRPPTIRDLPATTATGGSPSTQPAAVPPATGESPSIPPATNPPAAGESPNIQPATNQSATGESLNIQPATNDPARASPSAISIPISAHRAQDGQTVNNESALQPPRRRQGLLLGEFEYKDPDTLGPYDHADYAFKNNVRTHQFVTACLEKVCHGDRTRWRRNLLKEAKDIALKNRQYRRSKEELTPIQRHPANLAIEVGWLIRDWLAREEEAREEAQRRQDEALKEAKRLRKEAREEARRLRAEARLAREEAWLDDRDRHGEAWDEPARRGRRGTL
ncbi:hypothetical protein B0H63DRAFT_517487 [Podospora didyma]|uniref:Uncharacterized protein n=1 Tax=Podospora didyma TaxID=330526 RepID=A0AAE0P6M3_9PEZI|nr:hypothetical protein B0H63DRAFT_517487 [Podospora didyma]